MLARATSLGARAAPRILHASARPAPRLSALRSRPPVRHVVRPFASRSCGTGGVLHAARSFSPVIAGVALSGAALLMLNSERIDAAPQPATVPLAATVDEWYDSIAEYKAEQEDAIDGWLSISLWSGRLLLLAGAAFAAGACVLYTVATIPLTLGCAFAAAGSLAGGVWVSAIDLDGWRESYLKDVDANALEDAFTTFVEEKGIVERWCGQVLAEAKSKFKKEYGSLVEVEARRSDVGIAAREDKDTGAVTVRAKVAHWLLRHEDDAANGDADGGGDEPEEKGFLQEKLAEIERNAKAIARGGTCRIGVKMEIPPRKGQLDGATPLTVQCKDGVVVVVDPTDEQFWLVFHWPTGKVSREPKD